MEWQYLLSKQFSNQRSSSNSDMDLFTSLHWNFPLFNYRHSSKSQILSLSNPMTTSKWKLLIVFMICYLSEYWYYRLFRVSICIPIVTFSSLSGKFSSLLLLPRDQLPGCLVMRDSCDESMITFSRFCRILGLILLREEKLLVFFSKGKSYVILHL